MSEELMTTEVVTICNSNSRQLKMVAENDELFGVLEKVHQSTTKPKRKRKIMFKERIIIALISILCVALSVQHIALTFAAFNNGSDVFYPGWKSQDAIICLLMAIVMAINYFALLIVQREERKGV